MTTSPPTRRAAMGRPASTTHAELERAALDLFSHNGYDATSIDDIAAAVGIGRRTYFRYYPSKADVVWGDFTGGLARMRAVLDAGDGDAPLSVALREGVVEFNRVEPDQEHWHRQRMTLILREPALFANSTLRFTAWRAVVAEFAARRLGLSPDDLVPVVIGYSSLGGSLAAYEQWLAHPTSSLTDLLVRAFDTIAAGFAGEPVVPGD